MEISCILSRYTPLPPGECQFHIHIESEVQQNIQRFTHNWQDGLIPAISTYTSEQAAVTIDIDGYSATDRSRKRLKGGMM